MLKRQSRLGFGEGGRSSTAGGRPQPNQGIASEWGGVLGTGGITP